jgi:pimeloyl-ACP methyl ester carboxylesterase
VKSKRTAGTVPALVLALLAGCSDSNNNNRAVVDLVGPEPQPILLEQETVTIPSAAQPAHTPGSPGVTVTNERLIEQFGGADIDLNRARYVRYYLSDQAEFQPDAVLVLVSGFEGGASVFAILADQLMRRAAEEVPMVLEVWAFDRRSDQLEDRVGLDIAERDGEPLIGLDFMFGDYLGLELHPSLQDGPNRRVIQYNTSDDVPFIANWTELVHSQDIDAVVKAARDVARSQNVFLGGFSAGTGFTARYAATDFNLDGGEPDPGYARLRGLVFFEGAGSTASAAPVADEVLDAIEARFDGGLYGAVRDQRPRCVDGQTACSIPTQAADCAAFSNSSCTRPVAAFERGLLNVDLFGAAEVAAMEGALLGDTGLSILQEDQGGVEGNNSLEKVPALAAANLLLGAQPATSVSLIGQFLDDDGIVAAVAGFLGISLGDIGPVVDGLTTWLGVGEDIPPEAFADNGPAPTDFAAVRVWGVEAEPTDLEGRLLEATYRGETNYYDWYYPSSGLTVTRGLSLDTSALSAPPPVGRGRSDIANRTQAANIDIPLIAFGGSNGLTPVPGLYVGFAGSIAPCAAPSCDGVTQRVVDLAQPNSAFPTFGEVSGGYEVYIAEGYAHQDVVSASDGEDDPVIPQLLNFLARNAQ